MTTKWDTETTIKFIQAYKAHQCLWNFKSLDYKNKGKRVAAYYSIMKAIKMNNLKITDVKNKIKDLRLTYAQEMKKMQESKNEGPGYNCVYVSNIKWLKEMEDVFLIDTKKTDNTQQFTQEDTDVPESTSFISSQFHDSEDEQTASNTAPSTPSSTTTTTTTTTPRNVKRLKRTRASQGVPDPSNVRPPIEQVYSDEETAFDMFGRSVALQLKGLSVENALLAQSKIQSVLTEIGITDYRQKTASKNNSAPTFLNGADVHLSTDSSCSEVNFSTGQQPVYQFRDSSSSTASSGQLVFVATRSVIPNAWVPERN